MQIYKPHIYDFETRESLFENLGMYFIDKFLDVNSEKGVFRLAVSGGTSTGPILKNFYKNATLPWEKLHLYLTDERYVDETDSDSNKKMILESLGELKAEIGELNFFNTSLPIDQTVINFEDILNVLDGQLFDLTILGVGPDGHIASLFPGGKYLKHQKNKVLETTAPPEFAVAKRVSMSLETLMDSDEVILLIIGENKKHVLEEILEGNQSASNFPAKFLLAHPRLKIYRAD